MLVEADGSRVSADDSFAEDASRKLAKLLLLQRNEVVLADFGNGRDVFQRNAAGYPLHAQVFAKASHRIKPE
jgi:hypothetical protein